MSGDRRKSMFLDSMSRWPAGVSIVTAPEDGKFRAATVSSFTSLSLEPPQVIVAVKSDSRLLDAADKMGVFFVSLLAEGQEEISNTCAKFTSTPLADPLVPGASATFTCTTEEVMRPRHGTHSILVGRVDTCSADPSRRPLLHWNRDYHRLD